ncbi:MULTISPECIES: AAA-like domain-containing protein [unclassified Nodularia (in: cyanobacteria)]|uniref:AAA-like domain-containing protein n=1 Tax=Nodularia sp. LEGE 04288 TaxID=1828639 RepID=UPI0018802478|nr:AAA-like domain-containing protein [Nodularia sp. LEGE 06071]MCC2691069.1 AAA-like domain-containing protein [Nodularia sp. LEGE 04288]
MVWHNDKSAEFSVQKRRRGVVISSQGWQRLQAAEYLSAVRDNGGHPYTLEQLSDRTGISSKTLTKVRRRQSTVDQPTLASYFEAFGLSLQNDDYIRQELDTNTRTAVATSLQQTPLKGQLAPNSPFYIYRPPAEKQFMGEIFQPGALIRIRAPRQFGKTSLITQGLSQATEYEFRTAVISLQLADREVFSSLSQFLQWLCMMVSRSLDLPHRLEELWNPLFGNNYSCNEYFETYLLPAAQTPLLLVLDEVNVLFNYPDIAADFFGMLRAWYEQARHSTGSSELWQRLRLVIAYSTEILLPLNLHQSPFNVGLLIELPAFTPEQVQELAIRYGLEPPAGYTTELVKLVGGKPYLTQLSLFHLSQSEKTLEQLLATATLPDSIFNSHLRQQLAYLEQDPELEEVMQLVVKSTQGIELHPSQSFKLQGMGLIRFQNQLAVCSCELYQKYFAQVLKD